MSCHRARSGKGTVLSVPPPVIIILNVLIFYKKASQEFTQKSPKHSKQHQKAEFRTKRNQNSYWEKPTAEIKWQQRKFSSKNCAFIYAYDTNCLYWKENKLLFFLMPGLAPPLSPFPPPMGSSLSLSLPPPHSLLPFLHSDYSPPPFSFSFVSFFT